MLRICTGSPAAKKEKANQDDGKELHFDSLIPFKNHEEGLKVLLMLSQLTLVSLHPSTLQKRWQL